LVFIVSDKICLEHDAGDAHPESPARLDAVFSHLESIGWLADLPRIDSRRATVDEISLAHDAGYHGLVKSVVARRGWFDVDTRTSERSLDAALTGAGSLLAAADMVMTGEMRRGFCLVRPPGHHATRDRAMGFCLFNNIAVCARYLQSRHGVERVAILDFDVHHGNGTEDIFKDDPTVFFLSLHRYPFYPGTGGPYGRQNGTRACRNVPLPAHVTPTEYLAALDQALVEVAAHRPEVILVSAGFDAHRDDPIGGLNLGTEDFRRITERIARLADEYAEGRIISTLEGGYSLQALGPSVQAHLIGLDPDRLS
jgi:acetoin utilization deacetylase AcuC-like enzyme